MDEKNMQGMGSKMCCNGQCGCMCGGSGFHGHHMRYVLLRWLLGIIIISFVFWMGVKIGEFKGEFEGQFGGYGHRSMMIEYGGGQNMMYRTGSVGIPAQFETTNAPAGINVSTEGATKK